MYNNTSYSPQQSYNGGSHYSQPAGYSASGSAYSGNPPHIESKEHNHFIADSFLSDSRPLTPFISNMEEVKEIVEQAYGIITNQEFPEESIKILVCNDEDFRQIHATTGNYWTEGIAGFSLNRYGRGVSEIFVRNEHMDSLLLTVGHELGHVLSRTLPNKHDEEAKAHAFSLAWMETIRDNNIAGLQPNIAPNPARNGLHDVSFDFVKHLLTTGASSFDIFKTLATGLTSIVAGI